MVKGISRRVIVVDSPDPHIFEQAIFIVRNDAAGGEGVSSQELVQQAVRIAKNYTRSLHAAPPKRLPKIPLLSALLGGGAIGLLWLLVTFL